MMCDGDDDDDSNGRSGLFLKYFRGTNLRKIETINNHNHNHNYNHNHNQNEYFRRPGSLKPGSH